jgi:hypothetical protein
VLGPVGGPDTDSDEGDIELPAQAFFNEADEQARTGLCLAAAGADRLTDTGPERRGRRLLDHDQRCGRRQLIG